MAIRTHLFPHNLPFSSPASPDYLYMDNIHNTNNHIHTNFYNDLLFKLHHHQQQQCLLHFQDFQNSSLPSYNVIHNPPLHFSHGFDAHLDNYSHEIDRYIVSQEKLKVALQEETKKQMGEVWSKLEAKGMMRMQEKKQEIVKAREKRRELEERITRVEAEKEAWKRMAVEKESMVISLNNTFEQVKEESGYCYLNDAESWCDENEKEREEMEMGIIKCKVCKRGEASVVLLPCRHLCCCIHCHTRLDACPLCHSLNKASIHALFS